VYYWVSGDPSALLSALEEADGDVDAVAAEEIELARGQGVELSLEDLADVLSEMWAERDAVGQS